MNRMKKKIIIVFISVLDVEKISMNAAGIKTEISGTSFDVSFWKTEILEPNYTNIPINYSICGLF